MPFKSDAARRHHIPKQRQRVTNWAAYEDFLRAPAGVASRATLAWRSPRP